jgi:hypothetical protein
LSAGKSDDRLQLMDGDSDIHDADIVDDEEDADAADGKSKR